MFAGAAGAPGPGPGPSSDTMLTDTLPVNAPVTASSPEPVTQSPATVRTVIVALPVTLAATAPNVAPPVPVIIC